MTIAVDFDGTIVEHRFPAIGKERPFAIDALKKLAHSGHQIILWTVREGKLLDDAIQFCRERGLEFYAVNSIYPKDSSWNVKMQNSRKVVADIYIDDRNLGGLPDWSVIYEMIVNRLSYTTLLGDDYMDVEDMEMGRLRRKSSHRSHHHRDTWISRLVDRCRSAREKYSH